jgi:hypothetical protein
MHPSLFDPPAPVPVKRKRHRTATTSVDAYHDARESGRLHRSERICLEVLRALGRLTRHQIADTTGLPLSSVCGRVHSLISKGEVREVEVDGKRLVTNGRHVLEAVITQTMRRAG